MFLSSVAVAVAVSEKVIQMATELVVEVQVGTEPQLFPLLPQHTQL
jgi:hypothetical protein